MASLKNYYLVLTTLLLLQFVFMVDHVVHCNEAEDRLLQGINYYRASVNLRVLIKNEHAECYADRIADEYKDTPCSRYPGTTPPISNYPRLLSKCHLNVANTREGPVLPVCVPGLDPSEVLSNYTRTQYARYILDGRYVGAGIATDNDWVVVVMTTDTYGGSFENAASSLVSKVGTLIHLLILVLGCSLYLLMN